MWNVKETFMGLSRALEAVAMPITKDSLEQKDSSAWREELQEELKLEAKEDEEHNLYLKDRFKVYIFFIYLLDYVRFTCSALSKNTDWLTKVDSDVQSFVLHKLPVTTSCFDLHATYHYTEDE